MEPTDSHPAHVRSAAEAAALLAPLIAGGAGGERVGVLYLDGARRVVGTSVDDGGAEEVELPIRRILAEALRLGADALIVAHSHPSGAPEPSRADMEGTRILSATARNLGVRLDDHLIFGGGEWRSLRELGLL